MKNEHVKKVEEMLTPELQGLAKIIDERLPDSWGFGLFIFEMNDEPGGPFLWVSNARREDLIEALREFLELDDADK